MSVRPSIAAALLLATATGCATLGPKPVTEIELEPLVIRAGSERDLALLDLNDQELFQAGAASFAAGDYEEAARAFARLVSLFPESDRRYEAQHNAGLAWERAGEYLRALEHYDELLETFSPDTLSWRDAAFRAAEARYHLNDFAPAAALMAQVAQAEGVSMAHRIEALVKRGVCLVELEELEEAEASLKAAVGRYHIERRRGDEALDVLFPAQATFFLGEIYRLRFQRARLDPAAVDLPTLRADLEHKAQLLLDAQGHYLRTIRMGHPHWATASGFQIGRLYEVLFEQMTQASLPSELEDTTERMAYVELLEEQLRVLLTKAVTAYERTLATADRVGAEGPWRERVAQSLERVKRYLLSRAGAQEDSPAPAP